MFNDPTGYTCRFVYLISFIIISVAAFSTKYLNDEDEKKFNITGLIVGLVNVFAGALEIVFSEVNIYLIISVVLSLVFICVWTVLISKSVNLDAVQKQDKSVDIDKRYLFIFILCFLELGINSYICLNSQLYVDIDQYKYRAQTAKQIISDIKESDNGIYRIHYEPTANQNNATLYGYKGATIFSSSNQQNLKNFLFKIGLSCTDFEISDMGDTDLVKFLLGEKYIVHAALMDGADSNIDIQQNSTYAGLAFMIEMDDLHYINNIDLNNNVFENQNNIIKALGSEKPMFYSFDDNLDIDAENIEYGYDNDRLFFKKTEPYKEGYIIFSMPYLDGYDAYCYFNQGHNYISPTSPFVLSEKDNIICGYENSVLSAPHIVQMSLDDNNKYSVYLYFSNTSDEIVYIDEMLFYYYDKTVLSNVAAGITPVQITGMEDGKVNAEVTIDKTQLAYFSIPYEEGWSAYVDGESVSIVPVFENAFIGIELDEGTHEIELCFEAPMAKEGKIVSIVGIFALILLIILDILSNYKKKTDVV